MTGRRAFLQVSAGLLGAALGFSGSRRALAQAQPGSLTPVPGAYSAPGLAYASLFLADRKKLWAAHGLAPSLKQVEGGALAMVTLNSGDSEFVCVASTDAHALRVLVRDLLLHRDRPSAVETAERALADPRAARDSRDAARSLANLGLAKEPDVLQPADPCGRAPL